MNIAANAAPVDTQLLAQLVQLVGAEAVLTGDAVLTYSTDVYRSLELPLAVVKPMTVEQLQHVVRAATSAGMAVFTRGGGASYTDGYLPNRHASILVDMSGLTRIVEINEADGYVTAEAGLTWAALKSELDQRGLRTPFFGPFSGLAATLGGSIAQHSIAHGSAAHGISAQSVISLDVVLASGQLLRTGSAARGSAPFLRWYGPDLTGLFTGDCGALGIKARVTLPLLKRKPAFAGVSFGFQRLEDMARAMRAAALERIEDENFAIDAALSRGQIARQEQSSTMAVIGRVWSTAPSALAGLRQLLRMGLAGTRHLRAYEYTLHLIVEGIDQDEVAIKTRRLRTLMQGDAGTEIANTVPAIVRGMPFAPLFNTLGPQGERWVPLHGVLPHSQVAPFHHALKEFFASRAAQMQQLGVWSGGMYTTVGTSGFLYEIALYWPGAQTAYHKMVLPADFLAKLPGYPHSDATTAYVEQLKLDLIALYEQSGATHFQLGKMYPYAGVLSAESLQLLRDIKKSLDPQHLLNPGALDLPQHD